MIKKFYIFVWFLLAGSILFSLISGPIDGLQMVAFGLVAVALVYTFALWAVFSNAGQTQTE